MQKIGNTTLNGITFYISENVEDNYRGGGILLKVKNNREESIPISFDGSRYISVSKGVLFLKDTNPLDAKLSSFDTTIPSNSFMDIILFFFETNSKSNIKDGDRIEIHIENLCDLNIIRDNGQWTLVDFIDVIQAQQEKESRISNLNEEINTRIEHFEALEEKVGISIKNINVNIEDERKIKIYYEMLSSSPSGPSCSFSIEAAVYDKQNKIIGHNSIFENGENFLGFEVSSFSVSLDSNIDKIGRIVIYPNIIFSRKKKETTGNLFNQ